MALVVLHRSKVTYIVMNLRFFMQFIPLSKTNLRCMTSFSYTMTRRGAACSVYLHKRTGCMDVKLLCLHRVLQRAFYYLVKGATDVVNLRSCVNFRLLSRKLWNFLAPSRQSVWLLPRVTESFYKLMIWFGLRRLRYTVSSVYYVIISISRRSPLLDIGLECNDWS